ncbi:sigma factor [Actinophytocola sp.]|uniref:sigma factor n=1 Tax=Actinophytocola sp. TaxID=1872138 RepID=UPI003D6C2990
MLPHAGQRRGLRGPGPGDVLRAWRRRETYQGRSTFRAWLYKIATNASLDLLDRRPPVPLPVATAAPADPTPRRCPRSPCRGCSRARNACSMTSWSSGRPWRSRFSRPSSICRPGSGPC